MMSAYDCLNKKRFSSRRKVDSELAATTSVGSVFQTCGAATAKARLPTVDSLTGGTTRQLALVERLSCLCLSVCEHIFRTTDPIITKLSCVLPMAVARSSPGGVATRHVLPVLWMTSCSHVMARNRRREKGVYTK